MPLDALKSLGWDPAWTAALLAADSEGTGVPARIVAEHRGAYHASGAGGVAWCEATGRAFHVAADKRAIGYVARGPCQLRGTLLSVLGGRARADSVEGRGPQIVREPAKPFASR